MNIYKKILIIAILLFPFVTYGQYGNEWINFDNTYYKIKISSNGIYRIKGSTIAGTVLEGKNPSTFTLYRDGKKIPIYINSTSVLGDEDYIEFYGKANNGFYENEFFWNKELVSTEEYSVMNDTAIYFLVSEEGTHPRFENATNVMPTPLPAAEPEMLVNMYNRNGIRPGLFTPGRSYYSAGEFNKSIGEDGESFIYGQTTGTTAYGHILAPVYLLRTSSLMATLNFTYTNTGSVLNNFNFQLNSNHILDTTIKAYTTINKVIDISPSILSTSTNNFSIKSNISSGKGGINIVSIKYPRSYNFSGLSSTYIEFELPIKNKKSYLNFINLPAAKLGDNPILLNLTENKRFKGVKPTTVRAQYYLDTLKENTQFVFVGENEVKYIESIQERKFLDYNIASKEGNYVILTHNGFINDPSDIINEYANYRKSVKGGGYKTTIIDVEDLYDQFAYGKNFNIAGVQNFLKYVNDKWSTKIDFVYIIGKGISYNYFRSYNANRSTYGYKFAIPTFGHPGTDNLITDFNKDNNPDIIISRLSAWDANEVKIYLDKVKAYEEAIQVETLPTLENTNWKKSAFFIAGSNKDDQESFILPAYRTSQNYYSKPYTGGKHETISKIVSDVISPETDNEKIARNIEGGIQLLTFYGHASSTGFDYNLNNPDIFNIYPRFPHFFVMGCEVADIFATTKTIGEKYLISPKGGSISILASNNLGFPSVLTPYLNNLFKNVSYDLYGKTIGEQYNKTIESLPYAYDNSVHIHKQSILLQGDPALRMYAPDKVDYYTNDDLISSNINPITTKDSVVAIKTIIYNLGKSTGDSAIVTLEHTKPNGTIVYLKDTMSVSTNYVDTIIFNLVMDKFTDIGNNKIVVKVNTNEKIEEISYLQNTATINLFMRDDVIEPTYPYEFGIVYNSDLELKASALNVLEDSQNFIIQIDTTEEFNSPLLKETKILNSKGGLIKWKPSITMVDSQVYYWRTAVGASVTDTSFWKGSSFVYLKNGSEGWNQSHYYQYLKGNVFNGLEFNANREFKFTKINKELNIKSRIYNLANPIATDVQVSLDNKYIDRLGCSFNSSIVIYALEPEMLTPIKNGAGKYGSEPLCFTDRGMNKFEFKLKTAAGRKAAADFLDSIPDNYYVIVTTWLYEDRTYNMNGSTVDYWSGDAALYGEENTLYSKLKKYGFEQIDSFNRKRTFVFMTKKNDASFSNITEFGEDENSLIDIVVPLPVATDIGTMKSVNVGPSQKWKTLLWDYNHPSGNSENDILTVEVKGVKADKSLVSLYKGNSKNVDLSFIDVNEYPNLELTWSSLDSVEINSANLKYWRVLHDPLPEAALNPVKYYVRSKDSLMEGEKFNLEVVIENLTNIPMDSMLVNYTITKNDGTSSLLESKKYRPLLANDTIIAKLSMDSKPYIGKNMITIEANPNNDQPELFHPNNLAYLNFYTKADSVNPVLDVTFDGVHILDRDIVSAKPFINIILKDENKNLPLNDTALLKVELYKPGSTVAENIHIDGETLKFIPSSGGDKNEAKLEYKPTFAMDGIYRLRVSGKDNSGNIAGKNPAYEIEFTIDNKPTITNLLNYPNPFSTSTAFVFTMTGSEVPQQFKIQILTVTGKIVKEITKQELGPIRIGRNITEYKWDGKDQYGQMLGNGVYLYRLVTTLNGKEMEHRSNQNIDKYFKNGFGKMYIMR